jgi:hypothetical protein
MAHRGCIEIHTFLEGAGSEYLGDWIVEMDWGGKNPFEKGVQPLSVKLVKQVRENRTE